MGRRHRFWGVVALGILGATFDPAGGTPARAAAQVVPDTLRGLTAALQRYNAEEDKLIDTGSLVATDLEAHWKKLAALVELPVDSLTLYFVLRRAQAGAVSGGV